jgi:hypothetical protein
MTVTDLDRQRIRHLRDLIESNTQLLRVLRRRSPKSIISAPGEPRITAANLIKEVSALLQRRIEELNAIGWRRK